MNINAHLSLPDAPVGRRFRIHYLKSHAEICTRLRELGFCENAVVRCVTKGSSNIICEVCNTRVGLNTEVASGIIVSSLD
ncbi:MAG: ferrous iron transport protein A [Ignavibacteriae bacterium]|nr:ferrous iron transport protein A [Ignavibacteriota bacterium]